MAAFGIGALLFAHIAVAAHACPAFMPSEPAGMHVGMHMSDEQPPRAETDGTQPNLFCVHHFQITQQSVDQGQAFLAAASAAAVLLVDPPDRVVGFKSAQSFSHALLARVTAPPPTARSYCLRI